MLDRFERPLRILCLALAVLLVCQASRLVLRGDPLAHLNIPALPTLPESTNHAGSKAEARGPGGARDTNASSRLTTGTNALKGTNLASQTNAPRGTNTTGGTNSVMSTNMASGTNIAVGTNASHGTNAVASGGGTNAISGPPRGPRRSGPRDGAGMAAMMMGGGMPGGRMGGGMPLPELPPTIQARVDKITDSEILGPVMHPQPTALVGISDQEAYIRAPNGQTGPIKIGGEMGGVKLLKIGVNRVLIEEDGEKKELMMFGGAGGVSLMPKPSEVPANPTNQPGSTSKLNPAASVSQTNQTISSKSKETQ